MGLIGLPVSFFLYWLMMRPKKEIPFPKGGLLRLVIAGVISVLLSVLLTIPIEGVVSLIRLGVLTHFAEWIQAIKDGPEAFTELIQNAPNNAQPTFLWSLIGMFFSAGLLEEGLKFLTCRGAIGKKGMIRTWMDSVVAFSIVGITFELLENIAFGVSSEFLSALFRALASAHFVFGVIMGYFYGKYLVSGQKKYGWLSFVVPVIYHTVTNAILGAMDLNKILGVLGPATAISHIVATVVTVIIVIRWQKDKTLDVLIQRK